MIGEKTGEAAVPGPSSAHETSHAASNVAAILAIQKLEAQLDVIHLAPSGLRDAAIEIITEGINEVRAGDAQAYDSYTESARIKWLAKLGAWYTGFGDLLAADQRKCTDAYLRCDWHAVNSRIIQLLVESAIKPVTKAAAAHDRQPAEAPEVHELPTDGGEASASTHERSNPFEDIDKAIEEQGDERYDDSDPR